MADKTEATPKTEAAIEKPAPVQTGPSALDREWIGGLSVEKWIFLALFAIGIFLRLYDLGIRPYHHDESIHAVFSWKILKEGLTSYAYDPVYHGPVLYFSSALVMLIFGDNDFTGRLSAVLFGFGLMALAWPMRRYLGRWGAICFLALMVFSPSWTYFTRFIRHDIYLAALNMAAVYFAFQFGATRKATKLYLSAAFISLAFCNKEDMYLTGPIFLIALLGMMLWPVIWREEKFGEVFAETRDFLKASAVPIITSLVIFCTIWVVFYTSFGYHPEEWLAVDQAIEYWYGQQKVKRIGGPWHYYLPELILYEPLIFITALAAIVLAVIQRPVPDRFTRFVVLWSIGTLAIYAWAQEKVPWLLIPQLLPITVLAGRYFGRVIERGGLKKPQVALPLGLVSVLTVWSLIAANFLYDAPRTDQPKDKRRETMLSYVQSTYDVTENIMKRIEGVAAEIGTGTKTRLAISGDATWPFSWYVRHYPVNWSANLRKIDQPVLIVDKKLAKTHDEALLGEYEKIPFQVRGWWEPPMQLPTKPTFRQLFDWLIYRHAWSPLGSSDAILYLRKNVEPGKTTYAALEVNPPPPARGYPKPPQAMEVLASWGSEGTGNEQFKEPRALAIDKQGNILVVDKGNHRIQKLSPDGKFIKHWGGQGSEPGQFKDPHGIAVGPDGAVYVADTWNHRVQKFDANGTFLREWPATGQSFWGPRAIAVSPSGRVYVSDTGNKRVVYFSDEGIQIDSWGGDGSGPGQLIEPVGIAVMSSGMVVVADTGNRRLQFFDGDGGFQSELKVFGWEEFYSEPYIAVIDNAIYVTDSHNHRFARYRDGELEGSWGTTQFFNRPIGIAVAPSGQVYVADTFNHSVKKLQFDQPAEQVEQ